MVTTTLDDVVRIGFLVLAGFALALAVVWYLHYCYQEIRGTGQVVIDPLTVVEDSGKRNEEVGGALALMLQSRLESLAGELRDAQAGLAMSATSSPPQATVERVGDVRLWTQDVALRAGLLQPVEMKLSVGGVEVGGVVPWLQRRLSNRRTLHFTLYSHGDEAQVFGSVTALRLKGEGVRLLVKGEEGKAPSFDVIVDRLAHEIIRRWLAQDPSNKVELLRPSEFITLATVVVNAADSNRLSLLGRPVQNEFADLLPRITVLSDQVPDWPELGYFAAWIADKARDSATASTYYHRVVLKLDATKQDKLIAFINARLVALGTAGPEATKVSAAEPTKPALDYSSEIKRVRDSGPEGSVVGLALATALEFQIAKATHQDHQISARYIYYAARQASGTTEFDSGAVIADAIRVLSKKGAVEDDIWPYVAGQYAAKPPAAVENAKRFRITDAKAVSGLDAVKSALIQNGPVVAGITMYQSAMTPATSKTGVIPLPASKEQIVGGHAIVIVGYDDKQKRLKFVNSWGSSWGEHGFGYLPYEYAEKYMSEAWTFKAATT
ncbi:MAG: C1 family peptidase [Candidatus Methylomirabilales bacterium]